MNEKITYCAQNWHNSFIETVRGATNQLILCSPYISKYGSEVVASNFTPELCSSGSVLVVTDLSPDAICYGSTEPEAIQILFSTAPKLKIRHLPRLHAKVYIADSVFAIVTSANLTTGGLKNNFEYGIRVADRACVERIAADISAYSALGAEIDQVQLSQYCEIAREVRQTYQQTRRRVDTEVRRRFEMVVRQADDELVRLRLSGGAMHTVFADTILYLLRKFGPLTTAELHSKTEAIHPDLCDSSVDRIIDGKRFGKKWKHAVRTAQQQLKRRGLVELRQELWFATK